MRDSDISGLWGGAFLFFFVTVFLVVIIHGCNVNDEQSHKFQLEKLRIERQCPEVSEGKK
jgi:hypothetical protein